MAEEEHPLTKAVATRRSEVLASESGFIGECREKVPFGKRFSVRSEGKEFTSCTHSPPHTHPVR